MGDIDEKYGMRKGSNKSIKGKIIKQEARSASAF
jgi:hypothetical protein